MSDKTIEDLERNLADAVTSFQRIKATARGALEKYFGDDFYRLCVQGKIQNQPLFLVYDMAGECLERIGEPELESLDKDDNV